LIGYLGGHHQLGFDRDDDLAADVDEGVATLAIVPNVEKFGKYRNPIDRSKPRVS
jgi:hypothetical protein